MRNIVIATMKSWNIENAKKYQDAYEGYNVVIISEKDDLNADYLADVNPKYVFFPHWSWKIPRKIYSQYECVVFHETDLPFGRGGSPIQNLLVRSIYDTRISAIRVVEEIDAGPVYCKVDLDLSSGSVEEILVKASDTIFSTIIPQILENKIQPIDQEGEVVTFKRRTPEQSEIPDALSQRQIYDYIRMLDGEGYPKAYKQYDRGKMYFSDAKYENGIVTATVRFEEDEC